MTAFKPYDATAHPTHSMDDPKIIKVTKTMTTPSFIANCSVLLNGTHRYHCDRTPLLIHSGRFRDIIGSMPQVSDTPRVLHMEVNEPLLSSDDFELWLQFAHMPKTEKRPVWSFVLQHWKALARVHKYVNDPYFAAMFHQPGMHMSSAKFRELSEAGVLHNIAGSTTMSLNNIVQYIQFYVPSVDQHYRHLALRINSIERSVSKLATLYYTARHDMHAKGPVDELGKVVIDLMKSTLTQQDVNHIFDLKKPEWDTFKLEYNTYVNH